MLGNQKFLTFLMYLDYLVKWMVDESYRSIFSWLLQFSLNWKPLILRNFTVFDRMQETEALKKKPTSWNCTFSPWT